MSQPPILLGTSSFTASGWDGSFYPRGTKPSDYLAFYAERFQTVEIDSTFYACPAARTVENWNAKTPDGFVFSVKVPQTITHDKVLVNCDAELREFLDTMDILGPKLGPIVFQFPFFARNVLLIDMHSPIGWFRSCESCQAPTSLRSKFAIEPG